MNALNRLIDIFKKIVIMKINNILLSIGVTMCVALTSFSLSAISDAESLEVVATDYCDGWEDGYCEGWKDVKGQYAICPIAPVCPVPEIECFEGWKCGYNRGFKKGMRDARKN